MLTNSRSYDPREQSVISGARVQHQKTNLYQL